MESKKLYQVIYRRGGTLNATWHRTAYIRPLGDPELVTAMAELTVAGYRSMTVPYEQSLRLGLPEGYGPLGEVTEAEISQARKAINV